MADEVPNNSANRLAMLNTQLQLQEEESSSTILATKARLQQRAKRRRAALLAQPKKIRRKRSIWVRKWLLRRPYLGQYARLMNELKKEDTKGLFNFLRMDYELYSEILRRIEGRIKAKKVNWREPLSPGIKLAITLRYLASGDSYHSLMYGFRVAHNTISKVIRQVCEALVALAPSFTTIFFLGGIVFVAFRIVFVAFLLFCT